MNQQKIISSVQDLFDIFGGSVHLASKLNMHQYTVDRWRHYGIPKKYWKEIETLSGVTPAELTHITMKARRITEKRLGHLRG